MLLAESQIPYHLYKTTKNTVKSNPEYKSDVMTDMLIFTERDGCFDVPVVKSICDRLPFTPNTASFIKLLPGVVMPPHSDDCVTRRSHFIIPLAPQHGYQTTRFYAEDKRTVVDKCEFSHNPVIINTQLLHGVQNNQCVRIQFNLGFSESIDDFYHVFG